MFPSRSQWQSWSLPSKYTAIGLLVGVIALIATVAFSFLEMPEEENGSVIEGEYAVTNLGIHEVNYGASFRSKPKIEFLGGKKGGIENPGSFRILEQRVDGFTFEVDSALSGGTTIMWRATGER